MISHEIGKHAFYISEENKILATSLFGVLDAVNTMFGANINISRSKVSATSRNFIETADGVSKEAGFGYRGLYEFFKNELKIPVDVERSFARTSNSWHIFLDKTYKEAYDKYSAVEKLMEAAQEELTDVEDEDKDLSTKNTEVKNEEFIEQQEGDNNNAEDHERKKEKENLPSDVGTDTEARSSQDEEGTTDESGTPDVGGTGTDVPELNQEEPVTEAKPKRRSGKKKITTE